MTISGSTLIYDQEKNYDFPDEFLKQSTAWYFTISYFIWVDYQLYNAVFKDFEAMGLPYFVVVYCSKLYYRAGCCPNVDVSNAIDRQQF